MRGRTAVFASGMEARRVKTREAGLQRSRQPDPAGRCRTSHHPRLAAADFHSIAEHGRTPAVTSGNVQSSRHPDRVRRYS